MGLGVGSQAYRSCMICPRKCGVNRAEAVGLCGESEKLRIAWAGLHFGEEPIITKKGGSGTIFVSGCNLRCSFCQNYQISHDGLGRVVSQEEFIEICLALQNAGAENINIVTGSHHAIRIKEYLIAAKLNGLELPIVWNTSSYESPETIKALSPLVDVWLADLKTLDKHIAEDVFKAKDYPEVATKAIETMCAITPSTATTSPASPQQAEVPHASWPNAKTQPASPPNTETQAEDTPETRQPIVVLRYLALPSRLDDSKKVLRLFSEKFASRALLSLMTQYTPVQANKKARAITSFENRLLNEAEDWELRDLLEEFGIEKGFYQELVPDYSWLPDFTKLKTFSAELSKPIWHYTCGFIHKTKKPTFN